MKKRHCKRISVLGLGTLFLVAFFISICLINNTDRFVADAVKVHAEPSLGDFSFYVGEDPVNNGGTVNYNANTGIINIKVIPNNPGDIPAGMTYSWNPVREEIIEVQSQNVNTGNVILKVKSPGYSGITLDVNIPGRDPYTVGFLDIFVPLEWSDGAAGDPDSVQKNIMAGPANGYYGLLDAQNGDTRKTLQLYTSDSTNTDDYHYPYAYHYLRKLQHVNYSCKVDDPLTGDRITNQSVYSSISRSNLNDIGAYLEWKTLDTDVIELDPNTGFITAKSAGFATVTVKTRTTKNGIPQEIPFDVVVVPAAGVKNVDSKKKTKLIDDPEYILSSGNSVTLNTNAKYANSLNWQIYKGSKAIPSNNITSELGEDLFISDYDGTMSLNNLKAGVYTITAVPKKTTRSVSSDRDFDPVTANIDYLSYRIIVPMHFPPTDVILTYDSSNVYDSYDMMQHTNLPEDLFTLESENTRVAKESQTGVIDAVGEGNTKVHFKLVSEDKLKEYYDDYYNDVRIGYDYNNNEDKTVNITVSEIALNTSSAVMRLGGEALSLALIAPNSYESISWRSDDTSICTVDEAGVVTARAIGNTSVTATVVLGNGITKRTKCDIKVVSSSSTITLTPEEATIYEGENQVIEAALPSGLTNVSLTWTSSNTNVATIVDTAADKLQVTVKGLNKGSTVITASDSENMIVGTMVIIVKPSISSIAINNLQGINLTGTQVTVKKSDGVYQLYAVCSPELPSNETLYWLSGDNTVATVNQNGLVTIVNPGTTTITVRSLNGKSAYCTIKVLQMVEKIELMTNSIEMNVGKTFKMSYDVKPSNTSNNEVSWESSDQNVASVDSSGFVTAKKTGTCEITVKAKDGSDVTAKLTVKVLQSATDIKISDPEKTIKVGESYQIDAQLDPVDSTDMILYESSNPSVATVSTTGMVTAVADGNCFIFVRTGSGAFGYVTISALQPAAGIELDRDRAEIYVGDTLELTATILPENANNKEVRWESEDTAIATVDESGVITGVSKGSTIIKCFSEDGDHMDYCLVTVSEMILTLTVEKTAKVGVGKKYKLVAYINGEEVPGNTLKWSSSSKKKCKVTKSGVLKGVKAGKCTVTVKTKDGSNLSAKCSVRVYTETKEIDLNKEYVELIQGKTVKLKAKTTPSKVTYAPIWQSDDETIAVVKKGKVTALRPGDTVIRCIAQDNSEVYAVCRVHITAPVSITSFYFADESVVMFAGETKTIQYTVAPTNFTEGFSWSSSNPVVATVDGNGKITARSVGHSKITALSDSGKKNTLDVYVVGLSKTKITLHQYESTKINLQLDGASTELLDIRWDTDNQSIAEISNGKVTGKALGTTTVYAIVNGRYLACTVKVIKN